jgi:hypothetical protein
MKDWKVRQEIYHRLNKDYDDDLKTKNIEITKNVVENAIRYFKETNIGWIYPSKSYMVGICYARWLSENFEGNPIEYLNDSELLYNNDPYFLPYEKDIKTYNEILNHIGWNFDEKKGMVPDVKEYFVKEFML